MELLSPEFQSHEKLQTYGKISRFSSQRIYSVIQETTYCTRRMNGEQKPESYTEALAQVERERKV